MKKFILIFALLLGLTTTYAQNTSYMTAYELAVKVDNNWSDWVPCNITVKMDYDRGKITIYSDQVQIYTIIEHADPPYDTNGKQIAYIVIDQDGDQGRFRFRQQNNGARQIYVDFADISWCYSVK